MKETISKFLLVALAIVLFPQLSCAQVLVIAPTRLVFEDGERKGKLIVSNQSDQDSQYRVEVINRKMLESGKYIDIKEPEDGQLFADRLIRVSPRSFKIPAGRSQILRVHVRRPKGFEDGEYRTHLRVQMLPEAVKPVIEERGGGVSINVQTSFGSVIPLIVRRGELNYDINILNADITRDETSNRLLFKSKFERKGNRSSYGDITLLHTDNEGEERVLNFFPGLSVFTPNASRTFSFLLDEPEGSSLDDGSIKVVYREQKKDGGKMIAEYSKPLGENP